MTNNPAPSKTRTVGRVASIPACWVRRGPGFDIVSVPRGAKAAAWGKRLGVEVKPGRSLVFGLVAAGCDTADAGNYDAGCADDCEPAHIDADNMETLAALYPEIAALYPEMAWLRDLALVQHHDAQAA